MSDSRHITQSAFDTAVKKLTTEFGVQEVHRADFAKELQEILSCTGKHIATDEDTDRQQKEALQKHYQEAHHINPRLTYEEFMHLIQPAWVVTTPSQQFVPLAERIKTWFGKPKEEVYISSRPVLTHMLADRLQKSELTLIAMLHVDQAYIKTHISPLVKSYVQTGRSDLISAGDYAYLQHLDQKECDLEQLKIKASYLGDDIEGIQSTYHAPDLESALLQPHEVYLQSLQAKGIPSRRKKLQQSADLAHVYELAIQKWLSIAIIEKLCDNCQPTHIAVLRHYVASMTNTTKASFEKISTEFPDDKYMLLKFIASQIVPLWRIRACLTCATPEQLAVLEQCSWQDVDTVRRIAHVFDRDETDKKLLVRSNEYRGQKLQGVGGKLLPAKGYFRSRSDELKKKTLQALASRGIQANSWYDLHLYLLKITEWLWERLANQILPILLGAKIVWIGARTRGYFFEIYPVHAKIDLSTGKISGHGKADICIFTDCNMPRREAE
jgi:hypothetical protein